jgi:hypothetical protein
MASVTTSVRRKKRAPRLFPFDAMGAAALIWGGGFLALAFVLVAWLR